MVISIFVEIIANIIIGVGVAFMLFGGIALFRLKDFYPRLLVASKIDTVGLLTLLIGVSLRHGFSFFTAKIILITVIIMILNPMVSHIVARAAYYSGYQVEGELVDETDETDSTDSISDN